MFSSREFGYLNSSSAKARNTSIATNRHSTAIVMATRIQDGLSFIRPTSLAFHDPQVATDGLRVGDPIFRIDLARYRVPTCKESALSLARDRL